MAYEIKITAALKGPWDVRCVGCGQKIVEGEGKHDGGLDISSGSFVARCPECGQRMEVRVTRKAD